MFTKAHKRKEIQQIDIAELELEEPANKTELLELQPVPERGEAKMLEGDSHEVAVQLRGRFLTDGNNDAFVCGRNLAALKRFIKSWLTFNSR